MKKLLTGIFATLTCFACLAGGVACTENPGNNSSSANTEALEGAKDFLYSLYLNEDVEVRRDYEVQNTTMYDGNIYHVSWSVDVESGVVVERGTDVTVINVDELTTVQIDYVLTATITDASGNSISVSFDRSVLPISAEVPTAITASPVEGTAYKLFVFQGANKKELYINGSMKNTYYFATTEDFNEGIDLFVEYVEGSTTEFHLYHNAKVSADSEETVKTYINVVKSGTHTNAKYETTATTAWVYDSDYGTIVTTLEGTKFYLGADGTYDTVEPQNKREDGYFMGYLVSLVDRSTVAADKKVEQEARTISIAPAYVGDASIDLATVGTMFPDVTIAWAVEDDNASYADGVLTLTAPTATKTVQVTATFTCGEATSTQTYSIKLVPNDAAAIVAAAYDLKAGESFGNSATLTGIVSAVTSAYDAEYGNVTVKMIIGEDMAHPIDAYRLVGSGADVLAAGYTVTVSGVLTNYNGTIQFAQGCEIVSYVEGTEEDVPAAPSLSQEDIVNMAYELAVGASLPNEYTLTGVITQVNTAYDSGYSNVTVTIVVGNLTEKPIMCFRMKGTGADVIKVGDTITVTGIIKNYNGTIEYDAGCKLDSYVAAGGDVPGTPTLTTPEEIVNALYALTDGQSLTGPFTITGKITALDSYSNPTIVVEGLEDKPVYCYKLKVTNVVGDTITVTAGSMKNYNGTYEFMDCTLVTDGGEEGGEVTPPEGGDTPTEIATLTIPEANELGATKAHNTYTSEKYYVSGIVTSIYNTQYGNMYIVDENGNQLNVYGTYNADGSVAFSSMEVKPQVGEVVKLLTALGSYSNAPQAKDAWIVEISTATDAQKIAIEKAALSVAESVNGARELELDVAGSLYSDVAIAWEVTAGVEIATYANGILDITNPEADTTVTVKAILSVGEASVEVSYNIAVAHKEAVSGEETLATFTFGANGSAAHVDGSDLGASKTYSENGYDLELTSMSKVYGPAYDATGNSCIKLGTSSKTATLSFTVADDVDKVIINIAGYKAATSTNLTINGTSYSVKTASNNGEYTAIEIDTSTTKTITLTTVTYRAMIDSIVFIGIN